MDVDQKNDSVRIKGYQRYSKYAMYINDVHSRTYRCKNVAKCRPGAHRTGSTDATAENSASFGELISFVSASAWTGVLLASCNERQIVVLLKCACVSRSVKKRALSVRRKKVQRSLVVLIHDVTAAVCPCVLHCVL